MRVTAGRSAILTFLVDNGGGELEDVDGNAVTVQVLAGDGTTVVASGSAVHGTTGTYTYALPPQTNLDSLTAKASYAIGGVAQSQTLGVDIVAQRLASLYQVRQSYASDVGSLADTQLAALADQVEELVRGVLGYPPVLEGFRTTWDSVRGAATDSLYATGTVSGLPYGWGAGRMLIPGVKMPQQVYSGSINGVALATADLADLSVSQDGTLLWLDYRAWVSGRYTMWGSHGEASPAGDLRWAAGKLIAHFARTVDYPDRAASVTTESAQIVFSLPTPDRPTGIPEVDAVLNRYRLQSVI